MPRKLGQHFLRNKNAARTIVNALALEAGDTVIEIGPGHGELTKLILEACTTKSCSIIAIEKDSRLALELFQLKTDSFPAVSFELLEGDARELLPHAVGTLPPKASKGYKIAGNIPYYITGNILRIISELEPKPKRAILMIQKEVGERLMASPPRMNLLAAATQVWANVSIVMRLSAKDFSPPPEVDSMVVQLDTRTPALLEKESSREHYYRFIRILFQQPRKTILNNLQSGVEHSRAEIETILIKQGIFPRLRPQNLSIQNLITLSSCF